MSSEIRIPDIAEHHETEESWDALQNPDAFKDTALTETNVENILSTNTVSSNTQPLANSVPNHL